MPTPFHSAVIPAPVDDVWPVLRDFPGISTWHPAVENSQLIRGASGAEVSAQRQFTLADGGARVIEQLIALDDRSHTLIFQVVSGPFPVRDYISTQRLTPIAADGHTLAEWSAAFDTTGGADPDEVSSSVVDVFFVAGFTALQQRFA